jgi:RHS repeat-associated protein
LYQGTSPPEGRQQGSAKDTSTNGDNALFTPPSISLPKGGGAIRGIGEKFGANPVTGTGSMTVPIATSPGRSGFGPQLSLSYDSGAGNGPFGFGWSLTLPTITRKTDKGLPQYRDAEESDVYILSGAEDLVPVLLPDGTRFKDDTSTPGYTIHRYRPRIEGLFARIERWTDSATGEIHWRSITRDNVTTLYGQDNNSRIFDPADPVPAHPTRVFTWLICQSYDDKGNAIIYQYAEENDDNIDHTQANERNRVRTTNRYLKRITYGNRTPNRDTTAWQATDPAQLPHDTWMFEVVFDYGEGHYAEDAADAQGRIFAQALIDPPAGSAWPVRQDPFSSYRAGFEVRTYRLCRRVLMFHHFPQELGIDDCLVRSTEFSYVESPIASFISSVTQSGYVRQPSQTQPNRYLKQSLPPLEYEYSKVPSPDELARQPIREVDAQSLENLPIGLDGTRYQWVDLDGEGTSGILTEQADGWYYKRNLSTNNLVRENGHEHTVVDFGPLELVASKPAVGFTGGGQLLDLAGDGQVDLVQMDGPLHGFYERTEDASWEPYQSFISWPNLSIRDPDLRFVDLTGDGHADILITQGEVLTWYPSLAEAGFGPSVRVSLPFDEEKGPRLVFSDSLQTIYLADVSGDGLSDVVRICNGEVCYWPNLGYGHFGSKVTMDQAPWFDAPDQFDQRCIRLADTDGSGTTDILYLRRDGMHIYFNQSGNSWSDAVALPQFPPVDTLSSVQTLDLLGNGTACLAWSSPLPGFARQPMRYLALMEEKPHLLVGMRNNLGAETTVHYAPSTRFYLDDKRDGNPWITRLPFPVHVVDRVDTYDRISRNHFVTRYAYHHGYFDGVEREFRGFGMVEQWDTEEFAALTEGGTPPETTNLDAASHVPPVLTRTWFHTGVSLGRDHVSDFFAGLLDADDKGEYYREPGLTDEEARQLLLDDTVLPAGLTVEEEREACRALKGSMLRQEVYALDGTGSPAYPYGHPYTVTEQNFTIRVLQREGTNRYAVFFTHAREAISYHYERNLADPRTGHALTLEVDEFGNVLKSAAIGYGRRQTIRVVDEQRDITEVPNPDLNKLDPHDQEKQTRTLVTYTENRVTNAIDTADDYRTPLPAETRTYELTGYIPTGSAGRFQASDFVKPDPNDATRLIHVFDSEIHYEEQPTNGEQRRLIEQARTLYRKDDLTALLPPGELEPLALPGESYKLSFTPGLLTQVFQRNSQALLPNSADVLGGQGADRGGYVDLDGNGCWWIPSGRVFLSPNSDDSAPLELDYARQHFFLPHRYRNPFHTNAVSTESFVAYDSYDLLMLETRDSLGNRITVGERGANDSITNRNDYRVMQPSLITDPNGNRAEVAFDALGMVAGTAVMGKTTETLGDLLDASFEPDPTQAQLDAFMAKPREASVNADESVATQIAHDLLGKATTRIVYDLDRFKRLGEPPFAATLARETHVSELQQGQPTKIQISFSYSDGFGREIQKKIQAESGPVPQRDDNGKIIVGADGQLVMTANDVSLRWVGSGWMVFNNKGKPVRQYEPFFTDTHRFEFDVRMGVSPVLFYDPVERVVATLHPNHTYEKVVFDPWQQETWDVTDTVLVADPKTDSDVGPFFQRLPDDDYLPSWYALRTDPSFAAEAAQLWPDPKIRAAETDAATKAAVHANTPTIVFFDTLGRPFLTVAHNRFESNGAIVNEQYHTRIELDIEGNQRKVRDAIVQNGDALGRIVMLYDYDMLGNRTHQASMEAGERWMLNDVAGKPIRAWDSRGFLRRITYDALRRPTGTFVTENSVERLDVRTVYGEGQGTANNHRTRVFQVFDGAGEVTSEAYDFKGNLLRGRRELLPNYTQAVDWQQNPVPNDGTFTSSTTYDALNRPTAVTAPDNSIYRPTYNEANLLDKVEVNLRGAAAPTPFVTNIDYDAKGQRELIAYGNGAQTHYEYDPLTFRLTRLRTKRPAGLNGLASQLFTDPAVVQDLRYTYDPVGNITRLEDAALLTLFHNSEPVQPVCGYTYDALYRLIKAQGREHIGQTAHDFNPPDGNRRDFDFAGLADFIAHPNDMQAMRNYTEEYAYDAVGNFQFMRHRANGGGWTRNYKYDAPSLLEPAKQSNRLTKTKVGNGLNFVETYTYTDAQGNDVDGCITAINNMKMVWDSKDQLQQVDLGGGGTAYYVYDGGGQRVRKVIERQNDTRKEERIYLGNFEMYREYDGGGTSVTLERETLHVMDDKQRITLVETKTIENQSTIPNPQPLIRYQYGNHLGSASLELDDAGQIISYEEYYPYGSTSYQAGRSAAEASLKRYRYAGKERDEETGFAYHGARYYAPWLGRWSNCDPIGIADSLNQYRYAGNNPITLVDPNGLAPKTLPENAYSGVWATLKRTWQKSLKVRALLKIKMGLHDVLPTERYFPPEPLNKPAAMGSPPTGDPPPQPDLPSAAAKGGEGGAAGGGGEGGAAGRGEGTASAEVEGTVAKEGETALANEEKILAEAGTASKAGSLIEGFLPGPLEGLAAEFNVVLAYWEAKAKIISENTTSGFAAGLSARLLGKDPEWVHNNLEFKAANPDITTRILGAEGVAESSFNRELGIGYAYPDTLTSGQRADLLRRGYSVLASQGYRTSEEALFTAEGVWKLAGALVPTVNQIYERHEELGNGMFGGQSFGGIMMGHHE